MTTPDEFASLQLADGETWVWDPDYLDPSDDEVPDGVLAVMNRDGALFVLIKSGDRREWVNAERRCAPPMSTVK